MGRLTTWVVTLIAMSAGVALWATMPASAVDSVLSPKPDEQIDGKRRGTAYVDGRYKTCDYRDAVQGGTGIRKLGVRLRNPNYGGYSTFHVIPTSRARYFNVSDTQLRREFVAFLKKFGRNYFYAPGPSGPKLVWKYRLKSWQGIYDQLYCHDFAPFGLGTGGSWDLEGSRRANDSRVTRVRTTCGW